MIREVGDISFLLVFQLTELILLTKNFSVDSILLFLTRLDSFFFLFTFTECHVKRYFKANFFHDIILRYAFFIGFFLYMSYTVQLCAFVRYHWYLTAEMKGLMCFSLSHSKIRFAMFRHPNSTPSRPSAQVSLIYSCSKQCFLRFTFLEQGHKVLGWPRYAEATKSSWSSTCTVYAIQQKVMGEG